MGELHRGIRKDGKDELNLAEFPLGLLDDRAPEGVKTLRFHGDGGSLTITGSDAYGLPTAKDADVVIALLALTKHRNDFAEPTVAFSKAELLAVMGWPNTGHYLRRLDESLDRWAGVLLVYDESWYDNSRKRKVSEKFHVLEHVRTDSDGPSTFTWNRVMFASFRANNVRSLDLDTYFGLKSSISRQIFRFLGKRFWAGPCWTFDLDDFAFEHVGLTRSYKGNAGRIKQKLRPAFAELEVAGFLKETPESERYEKRGRGKWAIRLVKGGQVEIAAKPEPAPLVEHEAEALVRELVCRGVAKKKARSMVDRYGPEQVVRNLAVHAAAHARKKKEPGWLVKAIEDDYAGDAPTTRPAVPVQTLLPLERAEPTPEQAAQARGEAAWDAMTEEEQEGFRREALANATDEQRRHHDSRTTPMQRRAYLTSLAKATLAAGPC